MNWIDKQELERALFGEHRESRLQLIGQNYVGQLIRFQEVMVGRPNRPTKIRDAFTADDHACRIAASMVARDEAILLSVSKPRFSIRCYLDEAQRSFMNLRRLQDLWHYVDPDWIDISEVQGFEQPLVGSSRPQQLIEESSWVCDSLLDHRMSEELHSWRVVSTRLGFAYGEHGADGKTDDIAGTPYTQFLNLAGGCSESVCWMAIAQMHEYASFLPGIAEVNAVANDLAANPNSQGINIGGLSENEICGLFAKVGLGASRQLIWPAAETQHTHAAPPARLAKAISSYIDGNFPIVVNVEQSKLLTAYKGRKEWNDPLWPKGFRKPNPSEDVQPHSILIVGYKPGSRTLLVNDPSWSPFRQIQSEDLLRACSRLSGELHADVSGNVFSFVPVTPKEVKMPLAWTVDSNSSSAAIPGILHYAAMVQARPFEPTIQMQQVVRPVGSSDGGESASWVLWQFDATKSCAEQGWSAVPVRFRQRVWEHMQRMFSGTRHWCWVQCNPSEYVWIWDAESEPVSRDYRPNGEGIVSQIIQRSLICAIDDQTFAPTAPIPVGPIALGESAASGDTEYPGDQAEQGGSRAESPKLEPSLITSFCVRGFASSLQHWPRDGVTGKPLIANAELYCFMLPDVPLLLGQNARSDGRIPTAVEAMAILAGSSLSETQAAAGVVAQRILKCFEDAQQAGIQIRSFASWLPELASWKKATRDQGTSALRFLVELADVLRRRGHSVETIELVGGSRIGRFKPTANPNTFEALLRTPREIQGYLLEALQTVEKRAAEVGIQFVLELEPGAFFSLNDLGPLVAFFSRTEQTLPCHFNFDLAHIAFIKRASPRDPNLELLFERLGHVHACDHYEICHMDDLRIYAPRCGHDESVFRKWMSRLRSATAGRFDRLASLELECFKDSVALAECAKDFTALLQTPP